MWRRLTIILFLVAIASVASALSASAYPEIELLSVDYEQKEYIHSVINSIPQEYFEGIWKIQVYGIERWSEEGWYHTSGLIQIDRNGMWYGSLFNETLHHELKHHKCKPNISHNSKCYKESLD